ncbi:MAG: STAS domain-containing protein [Anaerolineales bacterium]|nr:STAS domain-containing protein [Anaerolineales bacterium]
MEFTATELMKGIILLKLQGRMDITGVNKIETSFTGYCAGEKPKIIVDLAGVDFLTSIGIRLLVTNAKSMISRGGKMVILNPTPEVMGVLEITDIPAIIPVYSQIESAEAVLLGS